MKNIFIIGSKGIPANYGGFETFIENLTKKRKSNNIKYHVACLRKEKNKPKEFIYNNARCFNILVPNIGPAKAVYYDIKALRESIKYIRKNNLKQSIIYVLACRIGPFINYYKKKLHKLDCKLYVNPDGHEWKRAKWNILIKKYWKYSEKLMVKNTDLLICDSINIKKYIQDNYKKYNPKTIFIAYGANINKKEANNKSIQKLNNWYKKNNITKENYYLVVGRFVPENNYKIIITEYMKSNTNKDLVLITNIEKNRFYADLKEKTKFDKDKRIKFVGTVYDQELLNLIRENAYAYIHGHEVGGTNPSLLEALATTNLNLLLDVGFNKEVGKNSALYWNKEEFNLAKTINNIDKLNKEKVLEYGKKAKNRIMNNYSWDLIISKYETVFEREKKVKTGEGYDLIDEIHKRDLELVIFFDEFCKKNQLIYYMIGGTLLGSIRHKGFIPWDDDMDLAMPREDYEKFLNLMINKQYKYKIENFKINEQYKYYITRLYNPEYEMEEVTGNITKLFIDIFPIDGMPNIKLIRKIHCLKILYHRMKLSFFYRDTIDKNRKRNIFEKVLIILANIINFKKIINPQKEKIKIDILLKKYSFYKQKYAGTIMGAYREREIVKTNFFGKPKLYKFENIKLYGPERYHEYLTYIYGDYMKMPKEEDRKIHCKKLRRL